MITILGAGGAIGNELIKLLAAKTQPFRLVGRNPKATPGATETLAADLTDKDQTIRAVAGSSVVHLLVGLKYDHKLWQEVWPRVMSNTIEACKRARAKLLFFDNVYMYGKVSGPMTEETPFNPCSKKGEIRAKIATALINESKSGGLVAMIARSADFYGPDTRNGVPNLLVFEPFAKKQKASWLVNDSVPHSFTYAPDAAQSLVQLAERAAAWNQTWHVPATPNPLTSVIPVQRRDRLGCVVHEYSWAGLTMFLHPTGRRLFENLREPGPQFRIDRVVDSPTATHLRYVHQ
jgi:nucleoside-diphosphate-sugar epimerase